MHTVVKLAAAAALVVAQTGLARAQTLELAGGPPPVAAAPAAEPIPPAQPAPTPATGPTVTFTTREGQPALFMTKPNPAVYGWVKAYDDDREGRRIAAELKLEEPANVLGAEIAAAFAASKGGQVLPQTIVVTDKKQDLVVSNGGKAAFVVDVAPVGLTAIYFPGDWAHYGLIYATNVRIIEASSGKVIGKAKCFIKPKKSEASPTQDELLGNDGAGLRKLIAEGDVECARQLKAGLGL